LKEKYVGLSSRIREDLKSLTKADLKEKFDEYRSVYPDLKYSTFERTIRRAYNDMYVDETDVNKVKKEKELSREDMKKLSNTDTPTIIYENEVVGVIGDCHFPFCREGYLEFCYNIFKKEGVTTIANIGDLVDFHALSRFQSDPYAEDGVTEYEKALKNVQRFKKIFKEWDKKFITLGNHDRIPIRQAATLGLPGFMVRSFKELFQLDDWEICTSKTIDGTEYRHGEKCTSTLLTAQRIRKNLVCGHSHSKADIQTHANCDSLIWGMHIGCGVDDKKLAFAYGKDEVHKSVISCATIHLGIRPQLHFMKLD